MAVERVIVTDQPEPMRCVRGLPLAKAMLPDTLLYDMAVQVGEWSRRSLDVEIEYADGAGI